MLWGQFVPLIWIKWNNDTWLNHLNEMSFNLIRTSLFPWFESNWILMFDLFQFLTPMKWRISWCSMKMRPRCCLIIWVLPCMWPVDCVMYWTKDMQSVLYTVFKMSIQGKSKMVNWINLAVIPRCGAIDMNIKKLACCARQNKLKLYEGADGEFMVKCNQANCSEEGETKD